MKIQYLIFYFILLFVTSSKLLSAAAVAETSAERRITFQGGWSDQQIQWLSEAQGYLPSFMSPAHVVFIKYGGRVLKNEEFIRVLKTQAGSFLFYVPAGLEGKNKKSKINKDLKSEYIRAGIRALVWTFHDAHPWARTNQWKSINKWRSEYSGLFRLKETSLNEYKGAFLSSQAAESSLFDFLFFTSYYFLPDENAERESFRCRFLAQTEYLEDKIDEFIDANKLKKEHLPHSIGMQDGSSPVCREFESWAGLDTISHLEILLASPSTVFVGSMFGHVFLRIVPESENGIRPVMNSRAFGFVAETHGPFSADSLGSIKGMIGLYDTILSETPFSQMYREYVIMEDRSMRRWKLNLTKKEIRGILVRMWTYMKISRYRYYFFSRNCGAFLFELINSIRRDDELLEYPENGFSMPISTLEGYIQNEDPLVEYISDPFESMREEMLAASLKRKALGEEIAADYGANDIQNVYFIKRALKNIQSKNEKIRNIGYNDLYTYAKTAHGETLSKYYRYFWYSTVVENYFSTQKNLQEEKRLNLERSKNLRKEIEKRRKEIKLQIARLLEDSRDRGLIDEDELGVYAQAWKSAVNRIFSSNVQRRYDGYLMLGELIAKIRSRLNAVKTEAPDDRKIIASWNVWIYKCRQLVIMRAYSKYDSSIMNTRKLLKEFVLVEPDEDILSQTHLREIMPLIDYTYVSRISDNVLQIQKFRYELIRKLKTGDAGNMPLEIFSTETARREYDSSYGYSGSQMFAVVPYYGINGKTNSEEAGVWFEGALTEELFGEKRKAGFPYFSEMSVFKSSVMVSQTNGLPYVGYFDFTFIDFRQVRPRAAEERSFFTNTGGHFSLGYAHNYTPENLEEIELQVGWIFSLFSADQYRTFAYFEIDAAYRYASTGIGSPGNSEYHNAGIPLSLFVQTPLSKSFNGMSHLRINLSARPFYTFFRDVWQYEYGVSVLLLQPLGGSDGRRKPLAGSRLYARFDYTYTPGADSPGDTNLRFSLGLRFY